MTPQLPPNYYPFSVPPIMELTHRYNASSGEWVTDAVIVKIDGEAFSNGAMRECFRLKKISNFTRARTYSTNSDGDANRWVP
jgi:elongation factor 2 kinase